VLQYTGGGTTGDVTKVGDWVNGALSDHLGNADYTPVLGGPNVLHFKTAFTAQRTITLPAASGYNNCAGLYYDLVFDGAINGANTAVIKNGGTTIRTQTVDGVKLRYMWRRGSSGVGLWALVETSDITGADYMALGDSDSDVLSQSLRARSIITGGGTVTVDGSGYVLWSSPWLILSNGRSSAYCPGGYWSIACPTSGTITGVGGASNKTATAAGIPLADNEALYYIQPLTGGVTAPASGFRVVDYDTDLNIPHTWMLICIRSGANDTYYFPHGINLRPGESLSMIHQDTANTAHTLVRRDASGNFSAGTVSAAIKVTSGAAPANASSTGSAGQVVWDADYIYVCTATNTWKRAAIATWP
jgi:hypothetical protein